MHIKKVKNKKSHHIGKTSLFSTYYLKLKCQAYFGIRAFTVTCF